jgi:hypothetical protein
MGRFRFFECKKIILEYDFLNVVHKLIVKPHVSAGEV